MRDVVLETSKRIYPWSGDLYPADDAFTNVVDLDDIAPFCNAAKYAHGWSQITNGLTSADYWKFIFYHKSRTIRTRNGRPTCPRRKRSIDFSHRPQHDNRSDEAEADVPRRPPRRGDAGPEAGDELRQDFPLKPRKCKSITLEPLEWTEAGKQPLIGIDNIWIRVKRSDELPQDRGAAAEHRRRW